MGAIWELADVEELKFAATASLLAIHSRRQTISTLRPPPDAYDSDSSDEDAEEEEATINPIAKLNRARLNDLKSKFLDRLGELLAREKSSIQQSSRTDSKHVAAAAWIDRDDGDHVTVLMAKNDGLDDYDRKISRRLQSWSRAIALTGRSPEIRTDALWIGNETGEGLLEYSRSRLEYHIFQISRLDNAMATLADRAGIHGPVVICLWSLCKNFEWDKTKYQLSDIVNIAYQLRYICWKFHKSPKPPKALRAILMLSRMRAAYECFKTTALSFPDVKNIEFKPVVLPNKVKIDTSAFRKQLWDFAKVHGFSKGQLKTKAAQTYTGTSRLHVHAEMQILVSLETNPKWQRRAHRYIGTSKKPCFLCNEFIQNYIKLSMNGIRAPAYKIRETHGKVYPLWTLPNVQTKSPNANLSMATAVIQIHRRIQELLHGNLEQQPALAESSAGVTRSETFSSGNSRLKQHYLNSQRTSRTSDTTRSSEKASSFGPKVKTVQVGRLPANGKDLELVPIDFYALPENCDRKLPETGFDLMPDFHIYWGAGQLDRKFRKVTAENQELKAINGKYKIYWNENDELPENKYIKDLLGIKQVDLTRRFWYGDAFILRYSEHPTTFAFDVHDVSTEILQWSPLKTLFRDMWDNSFLESQLERVQYFDEQLEKVKADQDIIFQRMYVTTPRNLRIPNFRRN